MKKFFAVSLSLTVALLVPSLILAQDIKKGDKTVVPSWELVEVKNLEPIKSSGNRDFSYGDSCDIQKGGTVTVVGIDGERLLVCYSISGGPQHGISCPSGVVFFIKKEHFTRMITEHNRVRAAEQAEKDLIKRLLE
jgi:hypothetical protein